MTSRDIFTQTDHEVHDVFYYKTRAFNAEVKNEFIQVYSIRLENWIYILQLKILWLTHFYGTFSLLSTLLEYMIDFKIRVKK